jgi:hypothetical protein
LGRRGLCRRLRLLGGLHGRRFRRRQGHAHGAALCGRAARFRDSGASARDPRAPGGPLMRAAAGHMPSPLRGSLDRLPPPQNTTAPPPAPAGPEDRASSSGEGVPKSKPPPPPAPAAGATGYAPCLAAAGAFALAASGAGAGGGRGRPASGPWLWQGHSRAHAVMRQVDREEPGRAAAEWPTALLRLAAGARGRGVAQAAGQRGGTCCRRGGLGLGGRRLRRE